MKKNQLSCPDSVHFKCLLAGAIALGFSGCSTWNKLDKTEKGAVIGTGSGALLGGAVAGTGGAIIGGVGGGVAGGVIGHEVEEDDDRDRRRQR